MSASTEVKSKSTGVCRTWLAVWLFGVAALVLAMIAVGGATRLTDSGLSITEWQPILGVIPPLSDADWQSAFDKYKQIPEFKLVNKNISLDGFKEIYWWEWSHRFLGRFIGVAFFVPFVVFWFRGCLTRPLSMRLAGIFLLGGVQGVIGWYMVKSGLVDRVDVSQYRLALHLTVAFIILGSILWVALDVLAPAAKFGAGRKVSLVSLMAGLIVGLLLLQVVLGAFVAGTKAGYAYTTWPDMNGEWIPSDIAPLSPWYLNIFEDITTIQFNHRIMAYLIGLVAVVNLLLVLVKHSARSQVGLTAFLLCAAIAAQMVLGIITLLNAVPIHLGIAHQAFGAVVFAVAVWHWHRARRYQTLNAS